MVDDADKARKKLKRRVDKMSDDKAERLENDKSRLRKWAERVLNAAWDVIKGTIGGFLASLF
jgi:hypothetical protein